MCIYTHFQNIRVLNKYYFVIFLTTQTLKLLSLAQDIFLPWKTLGK